MPTLSADGVTASFDDLGLGPQLVALTSAAGVVRFSPRALFRLMFRLEGSPILTTPLGPLPFSLSPGFRFELDAGSEQVLPEPEYRVVGRRLEILWTLRWPPPLDAGLILVRSVGPPTGFSTSLHRSPGFRSLCRRTACGWSKS